MSKILDEVLNANQKYAAAFGSLGKLAMPPARHFAVLTCMDARLDPAKYAGLTEGDEQVTTLSARSSSATNSWARGNSLLSITRIAGWSSLQMTLCATC